MKKYFIRCVGTNTNDKNIDVRISGIYELKSIENIILSELKEKLKEISCKKMQKQ